MTVNLWIPDKPGHDALGELPHDVSLGLIPHDGEPPRGILDAEFLVPPSGDHRVLELLGEMPGLRVLQTLSAGVDWLLPLVPSGVTLCDAGSASVKKRTDATSATASANTAGIGVSPASLRTAR